MPNPQQPPTILGPGDLFADFELPDQQGRPVRLSSLTRSGALDQHLGFTDIC